MKVLLIHQSFVGPNEPGGTRHYEFAKHFVAAGIGVTIIGSRVNYLTGRPDAKDTPDTTGLLDMRRVSTYASANRSKVRRFFSQVTFLITATYEALRVRRVDVIVGTSPPLIQGIAAYIAAIWHRCPFIFEIRDLWPEFLVQLGALKNPLVIYTARALENFLYRAADLLIVNSPAYTDYLVRKGVSPERIKLVANGVDTTAFDPFDNGAEWRRKLNLDGHFVVAYTGAMGPMNNVGTILEAARQLHGSQNIAFVLVGDGAERELLETNARTHGLKNVIFVGTLPKSEIPKLLAASDACIAVLQPCPMFDTTYPNKVFDYMAAGRPIILSIDGVIKAVVDRAGVGISVRPSDVAGMVAAIQQLAAAPERGKAMGIAGRRLVCEEFERSKHAADFMHALEEVVHGNTIFQPAD